MAITLVAFAHIHEPLPEFPALPPAPVALALPSMAPAPVFPSPVVPWVSTPEALNDAAPILALCPSVVPMPFSSFVPDHSVHRWLTAALPLAIAPWVNEAQAVPVSPAVAPVVAEAAPVVKKTRKSAKTKGKTPRKRSLKTTVATAQ